MIKRLLPKIQVQDGKYLVYDVVIPGAERAVETAIKVKDDLLEHVKNAIQQHLKKILRIKEANWLHFLTWLAG